MTSLLVVALLHAAGLMLPNSAGPTASTALPAGARLPPPMITAASFPALLQDEMPRAGPNVDQRAPDHWFAADKLRHFLTAFAITGYAHAGLRILDVDPEAAVAGGIGVSIAAGIGKEIRDVSTGRVFSAKDLAWDLAGAVIGGVLVRLAR